MHLFSRRQHLPRQNAQSSSQGNLDTSPTPTTNATAIASNPANSTIIIANPEAPVVSTALHPVSFTAYSIIPTAATPSQVKTPVITSQTSDRNGLSSTLPPANTECTPPPAPHPGTSKSEQAWDPWTDAFHKLSSEEQGELQKLLSATSPERPFSESVDELLSLTEKAQKKCEGRSLKFRFRGKEIIMRDIAGKIIFWLNKFKEIGDIAVNFDPVHAALPWAGVRFLLQIVVGEHQQTESVMMAIEKLSCLISRGSIYEGLYGPTPTGKLPASAFGNLSHALVKLYEAILRTMTLCIRLFRENPLGRVLHSLLQPEDVSKLLEKLESLEKQVEYEAENCERAAGAEGRRLLELLQEPILRTDQRVLLLLEEVETKERLEILDWISTVLYGSNHDTVSQSRTENTCEWIVSHSRYREWQDESSSMILWLSGTAGTGKTYLTSKVIDTIKTMLNQEPNQEGFAFFYCNRNEADRRKPLFLLRSWLRQLSTTVHRRASIQKTLKSTYLEARLNASELTIESCKRLLLDLINVYPRTTLVIDALDECERDERLQLMKILNFLLAEASNPLKIFVSSRPDGDIKEEFKDKANIEISATANSNDISLFVKSEIINHRQWNTLPLDLQTRIIETLQEKSDGMFQWAFLQIKQLLELQRHKEIIARLGKLPKGLKKTYDDIYHERMTETERTIASRAFQWVMCASRPLESIELLHAVCQDEQVDYLAPLDNLDENLLLEYCHNLLIIDPVRNVWIPSHLSVIEYFENHLWTMSQANCLVSSVCLMVCQNTVLYSREQNWAIREGSPLGSDIHPHDPLGDQCCDFRHLAHYATQNWFIHIRKVANATDKRLTTLLETFLGLPTNSSDAYRAWHRIFDDRNLSPLLTWGNDEPRTGKDLHPTSVASFAYCAFELSKILPEWHNFDWIKGDERTTAGLTYLELAVYYRSIHTCYDLIKYGADVNAQTHAWFGSALATAIRLGVKDIVEFFVKEGGADVNMQLQYGFWGSALVTAAYSREQKIVEFLVNEGGADVNMQLQYGDHGSALATAAYRGEQMMVEFLVNEGGADVNMQLQCGDYGSALAAAVYRGEQMIVEFFVNEGGADVNMQLQCGHYGSALVAAAYGGEQKIVEFLVNEGGADVKMQLQYGHYGSALIAAAYGREQKIVEFLVNEGGADVNMQLQYGRYSSALVAAAYGREQKIVEFLVNEGGADVNMLLQYGDCDNALAAAVYSGEQKIVEFLVNEGGADVNMQLQYGDYGNALVAAVGCGRQEVVKFLIKEGRADMNMRLKHGKYSTALEAARDNPEPWFGKGCYDLLISYGAREPPKHISVLEGRDIEENGIEQEETKGGVGLKETDTNVRVEVEDLSSWWRAIETSVIE